MLIFSSNCLQLLEPKFPQVFNQPQDGTKWGQEVGTCVGQTFATLMADQKK